MAMRNKLFRKIKKGLLAEGASEEESAMLARESVADRSQSLAFVAGMGKFTSAVHMVQGKIIIFI